MKHKIYICKQCGDQLKGQRRKFCSRDCNALWSRDQLKMDYGQGKKHNDPYPVEDYSVSTCHVPHNVLQKAKIYQDCHSSYGHHDNQMIVEDAEKVIGVAYRSLARNTPKEILKQNVKSYKANKIRQKNLEKRYEKNS